MEPSKIDLKDLTPEQKAKLKKTKRPAIFALLSITFFLIVVFKYGCSNEETVYTKAQLDSIYAEKQNSMAVVMGQNFVKDKLVSPGSADFPFGETYATYLRDSTFAVKGVVDSQNSFGALLRTKFYVKVKQTSEENWQLINIELY